VRSPLVPPYLLFFLKASFGGLRKIFGNILLISLLVKKQKDKGGIKMAGLKKSRHLSVGKMECNNAFAKFFHNRTGVILSLLRFAASRILSRFNIKNIVKELGQLGKKHGLYFLAYAICIEIFEDVVLPAVLYSIGKPHLIPVALAFHCEPVAYPLYFAVRSVMKKFRCL
jgi:hypothetical protein